MNEFDKNKSVENLLEETAKQVQPNLIFKAELEEKLRKAHKPRTVVIFPRFSNLASVLTGVAVLGALAFFTLWIFQTFEPQNNFGNEGFACPVTEPNGSLPPGETVTSPEYLGNGELWTVLWPDGKVVMEQHNLEADGSYSMKWGFYRGVTGALTVEGRRLDADAEPLRAEIPEGYGDTGFQVTALIFPTTGCWEVTAYVGESSLTFVTEVIFNGDAVPTAGVVIDPNATPVGETTGGYDFRGGKLFFAQPLPEAPASANVYNHVIDQPATIEQVRALANQFRLEGEIYTTIYPPNPEQNGYVISDGKRMLTVYTANYFTYTPDVLQNSRGFNGVPNDDAEAIIADFFKEYDLDFPYVVTESGLAGVYLTRQLAADGIPMQYETVSPFTTRVTLGENGEVINFEVNLMSYDKTPVGNYAIISAEDALDALLAENSTVGMMETGYSSLSGEPPHQWYREYPDNQQVTISGILTSYDATTAGQNSFYLINGVAIAGNISELAALDDNATVQAVGQFVVENGIRKFNIESVNTDIQQVYISGSLRREGGQIILTSDNGGNEYGVIEPPSDLPLNTEIGTSYLAVTGVVVDGNLDWSNIIYYADASSMGGGGGGGGLGFYQLNLSGTPIPFPSPVPSAEAFNPAELAASLKYTVQEGDTLESIAAAFNVPAEDIMRANYMTDANLDAGWVIVIPGAPGPTRLEGEAGIVQVNTYTKPDGSQRIQYIFISQKGMYYELTGTNLEPLQESVNRPITIWGAISYDEMGVAFLDMEKFEVTYPGLQFQILSGTQESTTVNGTPVLLFHSDGASYVILTSIGAYPDLGYNSDFPSEIIIEALIVPGETYEGYPALRMFNMAPAINPTNNEPMELKITEGKYPPMPDPYGSADRYVQPDLIVDSVELVYYIFDPKQSQLEPYQGENYIQPVWYFRGHYTNGSGNVIILIQALKQEYLSPQTVPFEIGG